MNDPLRELADRHFQECCGLRLDQLTAPLGEANPTGPTLRGSALYRDISEARREDDPTLPLGPWAYELKRADWPGVIQSTAEALAYESKDLQLCAWLLEGQIHHYGLGGIAPTVTLIAELCERYWSHLHPRIDDGSPPMESVAEGELEGKPSAVDEDTLEARANHFEWINEKLLPTLRQIPLTTTAGDRAALSWSHWEQAARNEQLRLNHPSDQLGKLEGPTLNECSAALAATATEHHLTHHAEIGAGTAALRHLQEVLDRLCGRDAPTFSTLAGLLDQLRLLFEGELKKRGVTPAATAWHPVMVGTGGEAPTTTAEAVPAPPNPPIEPRGTATDPLPPSTEAAEALATLREAQLGNRAAAYTLLADVSELLMRIEPHSPVPALLRRAVEWGGMDTRELYEELFLRLDGQLNIFELLGVEVEAERTREGNG